MASHFVSYLLDYCSINVFLKIMPHIKVVFLWPYARVGGVHPAYARAYAYAYVVSVFSKKKAKNVNFRVCARLAPRRLRR